MQVSNWKSTHIYFKAGKNYGLRLENHVGLVYLYIILVLEKIQQHEDKIKITILFISFDISFVHAASIKTSKYDDKYFVYKHVYILFLYYTVTHNNAMLFNIFFPFGFYTNVLVYHAVPREETETVDFDQDGRSRVAVSFRMNGVESTSADV